MTTKTKTPPMATPPATKRTKTKTPPKTVLDVADILLTHYGYRDLSKLRTMNRETSTLHTDTASRTKQASELMDTMVRHGLPRDLAEQLPSYVYHTLRSNRYAFTEHDPSGWRRHPRKCVLWKAWGSVPRHNYQFAIAIKGYADILVRDKVVQRTDAIIILKTYHYPRMQTPTMYGSIYLQKRRPQPEFEIMNSRNAVYSLFPKNSKVWDMGLVADLLRNACRKPSEREVVVIPTGAFNQPHERDGLHLPTGAVLHFMADAKAPW
jgi:hypothetical protein